MLSYTSRRNLAGSLANTTSTANLSLLDTLMNDSEKRLIATRDFPWLWRQYTKTTTASTQAITLPAYTHKPQSVYVTVGSYRYVPIEVTNRADWDAINEVVITSDIVTHYFVYDGQIQLFPTPASTGNVVTFNARRRAKDLTKADYTTGTITTTATAGFVTTVTGSGTTWGAGMVGRYLRIDQTDASNGGDGFWYEIATVPSSTTLTLTRTYQGTAITAGSSTYTTGDMSLIPEEHEQLPVFEGLKIYFTSVDPNPTKAKLYGELSKEGSLAMFRDYTSKVNVVLDSGGDASDTNPSLMPSY